MWGIAPGILWLLLLVILIIVEFATVGLVTIWFAAGALAACIVSWFSAPIWLQITVFFLVSIVMLVFTRPFAMKYINKNKTKTNVDSMIGKHGVVTKKINNIKGEGQVVVQGMEWTARAEQADILIDVNETVVIRAVSGVKLIVAPTES